jgi:carboxypeptidase family protein/TonB-dependent receptor-like protein
MKKRCIVRAVLFALLMMVWVRPAFAQLTTALAQLNGTVRDESGAAVPKAMIGLKEESTNRTYTAISNQDGFYLVPNLPPGRYELTAEYTGFGKYKRTGIALSVGQVATLEIMLRVQAVTGEVMISSDTPPVEPTRTEVSQVISTQQIQSLPISGRQFIDFALLTPGVATGRTSFQSPFTEPETTRISFGGMRDLNNGVTVDGADYLNSATSSQRATPSQEAVSEFRVVNNSFTAEYGRALGGIVNIVTKTGTNEWHGSVYEYLRNDAVDARSILTLPQFDTLRQNQFGATLGGPLRKDRTFLFTNYEGQRRAQSPTYPAPLIQNLDAINRSKMSLGLSPENLGILKTSNYDNGFIKVDHQLNKDHQLAVRYLAVDSRNLNLLVGDTLDGGGAGAPSSGRNGLLRDQSVVTSLTSQISPALINTALVQWARRHYGFLGATNEPNLDIPNLLLFGHNFGSFDRVNESRVQASDTLATIRGQHYLKFGFDANHVRNFVIWPGFTPARIILPGVNCMMTFADQPRVATDSPCPVPPDFNGVASFFWGAPVGSGPIDPNLPSPPLPTSWQFAYLPSQSENFNVRLNHGYWGLFLQDQWRVTPKLTVNYGVRYDLESGLGFLVNGDRNNVAPRVAIAYAPNKQTVIRAGYGLFYDRYNLTFLFISSPQRAPRIAGLPVSKNMDTGTWLLNQVTVQAGPPPVAPDEAARAARTLLATGAFPPNLRVYQGGSVVDRDSRTPYSQQANLQIDREIGNGLVLSAGYLFVGAHKQVRPANLNIGLPVGTLPNGKSYFDFGKVDPNAGIFYYTDNSGNSVYHGLTVSASERFGQYIRLNANYTLSKTLDDGTFAVFVSTPEDLYNRQLERALSIQDVRHRFVANFTAAGREKTLFRGFELSSIVTVQSPRPFTIFAGFDVNADNNPVTDRVGLSGRNTYRGDRLRAVDLRLSRIFGFGQEKLKLQLIAECFNLFNRANVNEVNSVYGAPDFVGKMPGVYKDGTTAPNPFFGTPRNVFNPRQFQFAAKFLF